MRPRINTICKVCGAECTISKDKFKGDGHHVCSRECSGKAVMRTPPDEAKKKAQIRAHGLINMRVSRRAINKPTICEICGISGKLDGHHPDYNNPDIVKWLCRSCHAKIHFAKEK